MGNLDLFQSRRLFNKWLLIEDILIMNQLMNMGNPCLGKDKGWSLVPPIQLHFQVMCVAIQCPLKFGFWKCGIIDIWGFLQGYLEGLVAPGLLGLGVGLCASHLN